MTEVKLLGRIFITGEILTVTGLHIGGSPGALAIGSLDLPVIRDAQTGRPYIPGSSLKGKMRSLAEKYSGAPQNKPIGKDVRIHVAGGDKREYSGNEKEREAAYTKKGSEQYQAYWVNPLFGVPGEVGFKISAPNRLVVRDTPMLSDPNANPPRKGSVEDFLNLTTDLPFTEVKWEAAIDRVTSAATPRQLERVPAGAIFAPMELVFNYYLDSDTRLLESLLTAMQLLEDDYLGGQGSRGSGKITFQGLKITIRYGDSYQEATDERFTKLKLTDLIQKKSDLVDWVKTTLTLKK
jgi:CRISPR-associated protein Csm3